MKQCSEPLALGRGGSQRTPRMRKYSNNIGKLKTQENVTLRVTGFKFRSSSDHTALWPWGSHFPSLGPSVHIFKIRLIKWTLSSRVFLQKNKKINRQELCKSVQWLLFHQSTHLHPSQQGGERWFTDGITWVRGFWGKWDWRARP